MLDYFGPSMETTLTAIGNAVALFATHPDQWQLLRDGPSLMTKAFNEVVRLETPLRAFTRVTAHDTTIGGTHVAEGTRIAVFLASANAGGPPPTVSTSPGTTPTAWARATANTAAPARAWPAWSSPPCSPAWPIGSSASSRPATSS